jgi:hypothetical protein
MRGLSAWMRLATRIQGLARTMSRCVRRNAATGTLVVMNGELNAARRRRDLVRRRSWQVTRGDSE